jgi:diacylglycerol kinase (ATP)
MGIGRKLLMSATDVGRIARAAGNSISGLRLALRKEAAFRQELLLFLILVPLGAWLGHDGVERALLIGTLFLVLIVELLNSAIETAIDRISKSRHKLSRRAKDMGSAAVYLSLLLVVVVWGLVLSERFLPIPTP